MVDLERLPLPLKVNSSKLILHPVTHFLPDLCLKHPTLALSAQLVSPDRLQFKQYSEAHPSPSQV